MMTIFSLIVLLLSTIIHEIAHGSMAYYLGDPTAKNEGRLTVNPLMHLDPFGSIFLPLSLLILSRGQGPIFGWAKPVPINPYNFRDRRWGAVKVALAGPATNFIIGVVFSLICRFFVIAEPLKVLFEIIIIYNFAWAIFNLMPIPPLDGHWILFSFLGKRWDGVKIFLSQYGFFILLFFILFGLSWVFYGAEVLYFLIAG